MLAIEVYNTEYWVLQHGAGLPLNDSMSTQRDKLNFANEMFRAAGIMMVRIHNRLGRSWRPFPTRGPSAPVLQHDVLIFSVGSTKVVVYMAVPLLFVLPRESNLLDEVQGAHQYHHTLSILSLHSF